GWGRWAAWGWPAWWSSSLGSAARFCRKWFGRGDVGQLILAGAAFRGGSAPEDGNGSCLNNSRDFSHWQRGRLKGGCSQDWLPHVRHSRPWQPTLATPASVRSRGSTGQARSPGILNGCRAARSTVSYG